MHSAYRLIDKLTEEEAVKTSAIDIKSRADFRKLGPFIDENINLLCWVNWGNRKDSDRKIKPYFRHYPFFSRDIKDQFYQEVRDRMKLCNESPLHKKAKSTMVALLNKFVNERRKIIWKFCDKRNSYFYLQGDLLREVKTIEDEFRVHTPFDIKYKHDIVLLGEKIFQDPLILGAIELELNHQFDISKTLICKSLSYPLISIDLSGLKEEDITEDWCYNVLIETTNNPVNIYRKSYIYIHNMLYSIFLQIPRDLKHIRKESNHQYLVFIKDDKYELLLSKLENLKKVLGLSDNEVLLNHIIIKNQQMKNMIENEGSICGKNWKDYNDHKYIRIIIKFPYQLNGNLYKYHLIMFYQLNSIFDCLVGYKYKKKMTNYDPQNKFWMAPVGENISQKVILKSLSEPIIPILKYLDKK